MSDDTAFDDGIAFDGRQSDEMAVVLGGDEIASAIAVLLAKRGWVTVLSHNPREPVLKRSMAFYDTLFGDAVVLEGIVGKLVTSSLEIHRGDWRPSAVAVTPLDPMDLIACGPIGLLVDARRHGECDKPDLRWLADLSYGVGPGWYGGFNCSRAVPVPPSLTDERVIVASSDGAWYTPIEPGMRVFRHMTVGKAGSATLTAPCDGIVAGILRDGLNIAEGAPVASIAPHLRRLPQGGLDPRGKIVGLRVADPRGALAPARCVPPYLRVS